MKAHIDNAGNIIITASRLPQIGEMISIKDRGPGKVLSFSYNSRGGSVRLSLQENEVSFPFSHFPIFLQQNRSR